MILYQKGKLELPDPIIYPGKIASDDNIYTFDTESTSLFKSDKLGYGWTGWKTEYRDQKDLIKAGVTYIWMASINDKVYYHRDIRAFGDFLREISDPNVRKFIYVHNLGWDFQALIRDILQLNCWTVERMIARAPRKPIAFTIPELNIQFRCSLRLTELSLEKCGERYQLDLKKHSGDLDYDLLRGPSTPLTKEEMGYAEFDCLAMYDLIKYFRDNPEHGYKHIKRIPYTQTGEMRYGYRKKVEKNHIFFARYDVPKNPRDWKAYNEAMIGGYVHANRLYAGENLLNMVSKDICSSYPTEMVASKMPYRMYYRTGPIHDMYLDRDKYAIIYHVRFKGVESKRWNTFWSVSKGEISIPWKADNGRLVACKSMTAYMTDIDYDLFLQFYDVKEIEVLEWWVGKKEYLPTALVDFALTAYEGKTKLKGIDEAYQLYMKLKQMLNSLFGAACCNVISNDIEFIHGEWAAAPLTDEVIAHKLEELRASFSQLFWYLHGVYTCARSRQRVCNAVLHFDEYMAYSDTDSIKLPWDTPGLEDYFVEDSKAKFAELVKACEYHGIDPARLTPFSNDGLPHPLGYWETDGHYAELKALQSKAYCYREWLQGDYHVCVSGVGKAHSSELIHTMADFHYGMYFDEYYAGKREHTYIDNQKPFEFIDYMGNRQQSFQQYGVTLNPTTYKMGANTCDMIKDIFDRKVFEENWEL